MIQTPNQKVNREMKYKFTLADWNQFWKELLESLSDKDLVESLKVVHEARRIDLEKRHFRRILNF